jgi:hypothetical protein
MLDLRRHLAASRKDLARFGLLFFAVSGVLSGYLAWKGSPAWPVAAIAAVIFLTLRLTMPMALRPLYVVWMALGSVLAWVNTRLILGVVFYLVLTPISLAQKLLGKDHMGLRIERPSPTYWITRTGDERGRERYEQMF